ncbi:MAG: hypothetical protein JWR18_3959 [Segetibacter sp.]|nr:hypothetical protein [Segetibacter sp.]
MPALYKLLIMNAKVQYLEKVQVSDTTMCIEGQMPVFKHWNCSFRAYFFTFSSFSSKLNAMRPLPATRKYTSKNKTRIEMIKPE